MLQLLMLFIIYTWWHCLVLLFDNIEWIEKTWYQKLITLIAIITFWLGVIIWLILLYMILT